MAYYTKIRKFYKTQLLSLKSESHISDWLAFLSVIVTSEQLLYRTTR